MGQLSQQQLIKSHNKELVFLLLLNINKVPLEQIFSYSIYQMSGMISIFSVILLSRRLERYWVSGWWQTRKKEDQEDSDSCRMRPLNRRKKLSNESMANPCLAKDWKWNSNKEEQAKEMVGTEARLKNTTNSSRKLTSNSISQRLASSLRKMEEEKIVQTTPAIPSRRSDSSLNSSRKVVALYLIYKI